MMLFGTERKKSWRTALFLCAVFAAALLAGACFRGPAFENRRFESFAKELFRNEIRGNSLTLHYTLADPGKLGISQKEPSLGTFLAEGKEIQTACKEIEKKLASFSGEKLSEKNRITRDHLLLSVHTRCRMAEYPYLEEPLSPSLGIQAQLPVLLAEYAFYSREDIVNYLKLLKTIRPYFDSILSFEKEKSAAGFFMSEASLNRVLDQCASFIRDPDSNYMQEIFAEKLKEAELFSPEEIQRLLKIHKHLLISEVLPAYKELMLGLEKLREEGRESCGLAAWEGGAQYYESLLQSTTGCYWPIRKIEEQLGRQMTTDLRAMNKLVKEHPALSEVLEKGYPFQALTPEEALEYLRKKMRKDFPSLTENPSYEVRYVHPSMEQFLSPAFYLTPPLDIKSPNIIYINSAASGKEFAGFTTLAHEGFPGHLYQTLFFASGSPLPVQSVFASGGYVEGWATYVESVAALYGADLIDAPERETIARMEWLNRSINLCLYSLMDIGIHAHGWNQARIAGYLQAFGIKNEASAREIYQYIVENPANYPKYYLGYLNFLELREAERKRLGNDFDLKEFHKKVLEMGPVAFPVLKKYLDEY